MEDHWATIGCEGAILYPRQNREDIASGRFENENIAN